MPEVLIDELVSTHIRLESRMNRPSLALLAGSPFVSTHIRLESRMNLAPGLPLPIRAQVSTHIRLESRMNLHQRKRASGRSLRPEIAIVLAGCFKPASFGLPGKKSLSIHLSFMREPPVILRLLWIRGILYHKTAFLSRPKQRSLSYAFVAGLGPDVRRHRTR